MGSILVGVLIGNSGFGLIQNSETIQNMGELGLILLLFFVGMEISLPEFKNQWKISLIYSKHLAFRIFGFFFFLFSVLKFATVTQAMLENLCLDKRKNKSAKFSKNLNALSIGTTF